MSELDVTRAALRELGEVATNEQLAAYARERHGSHLDPRFISLYRATIRGEEQRKQARAEAARILEEDRKGKGT